MAGGRAAGKYHRYWIIAASSVLGIAAATLVMVLMKDSTSVPAANPTAANFDVDRTGGSTPDWFTPSVPVSVVPGSAPPAVPFVPPEGGQSEDPGGSPTGRGVSSALPHVPPAGSAGDSPPKRGDPSPPAQNATAYNTIQGESFDQQSGVKAEADKSGPGVHIGFISTGDWVRYDDIGFTDAPANALLISASNAARQNRTGQVELRLDSRSNAPVGSLTIVNNGDWFAFTTYTMNIKPITGVHTVFLTFTSNQNEEFANIDSFRFRH